MESTRRPLPDIETFAAGILRLSEATMEKAIRVISVERGYDPRDFTLVAFGGAGPLHACALAKALRLARVLVPRMPGALSALGILISDTIKDYSRTVMAPPDLPVLERHFSELEQRAKKEFVAEGLTGFTTRSLDLRYAAQGYELNVSLSADAVSHTRASHIRTAGARDVLARFHAAHRQRYGYSAEKRAVEVVNVRVRAIAAAEPIHLPKQRLIRGDGKNAVVKINRVIFEGRPVRAPLYDRALLHAGDSFAGPCVIAEYSATTVVPPGWRARVDAYENILIESK
jgi:N-methylhydantoinase A